MSDVFTDQEVLVAHANARLNLHGRRLLVTRVLEVRSECGVVHPQLDGRRGRGHELRDVSAGGSRHASAKTTLDTYGHLWPDSDDSTRAAVEAVLAARADSLRTAKGGEA